MGDFTAHIEEQIETLKGRGINGEVFKTIYNLIEGVSGVSSFQERIRHYKHQWSVIS